MRTDLPAKIAAAARVAARMDYRVCQLEALVDVGPHLFEATRAEQMLRLTCLKRDIARADLERLRNEFRLTLIESAFAGGRDAA